MESFGPGLKNRKVLLATLQPVHRSTLRIDLCGRFLNVETLSEIAEKDMLEPTHV